MQGSSESDLGVSSSFSSSHSTCIPNVVRWLIEELGLTEYQAKLIFYANGGGNRAQLINLFIKNEDMYIHLFCPSEGLCEVCGQGIESHSYVFPERHQEVVNRINEELHRSQESAISDSLSLEESTSKCLICDYEYTEAMMASFGGTLHEICSDCFGNFLREEILSAKVVGLKCPHCNLLIDTGVVAQYVDAMTYKKYKIFLNDKQILKNPNLRWCPNPRCGKVVNVKSKGGKAVKCACGMEMCVKCNREAHSGMSCKQVFEKETKAWGNTIDVQNCKKCNSLVEKVSGCNHMTCQICKYEWCWLCKSSYSTIHFSPLNPFGCAGLQNGEHQSRNWGCFTRFLYRLGLLLLFLILIPIALPFALLCAGPSVLLYFLNRRPFYWGLSACEKFPFGLLAIIFGMVANPIIWIGLLILFIPKGVGNLIVYYRNTREMEAASSYWLNQRLIQEGNFDDLSPDPTAKE